MKNCPFCNINKERSPIIFEGKTVFVTLSNPRLAEGHLLVIPKRHIQKPSEMTEEERKELFDTLLAFQDKILSGISQGCDIKQNCRIYEPESETKVFHVHFHLIPRQPNDEIKLKINDIQESLYKMLSQKELENSTKLFNN